MAHYVFRGLRLLPGINYTHGEGLPFVDKARQSEHSRAYVTFGATQQTDGKTSQGGIIISRNSLSSAALLTKNAARLVPVS